MAHDGEAALEEIRARGGPSAFNLILCDLHMPRKVWGCISNPLLAVSQDVPVQKL